MDVLLIPPADTVAVVRVPAIGLWKFPVFVSTMFTIPSDSTTSYVSGLRDTTADSSVGEKKFAIYEKQIYHTAQYLPSSLTMMISALSWVMDTSPIPVLCSLPKNASSGSIASSFRMGTVTVVDDCPCWKFTGMALVIETAE